jgi:hypothetical protein
VRKLSKADTQKEDDYVIFTNPRTKLSPEKRKQIIDITEQMFAEDFGEKRKVRYEETTA